MTTTETPAPTFLTVEEVAARWHTTPKALHAQRYRGEGPEVHRLGRRVLYRLDELEAYEESRREPHAAAS